MTDYEILNKAVLAGWPPVARPKELEENTDLWFEYSYLPYGKGNIPENKYTVTFEESMQLSTNNVFTDRTWVTITPDPEVTPIYTYSTDNSSIATVTNDGTITTYGTEGTCNLTSVVKIGNEVHTGITQLDVVGLD